MDLTPATATGMNPIPAVRGAFTGNHAVVCTGLVRSVVQHSKHRPCFVRGVGVERLRLDSAIRKSSIQYTRLHSVSLILRLQSDEAAIQAFCGGSRKTRASLEADLSLSLALNTEMSQVALIDNVFGLPASFLARGAYLCFFSFSLVLRLLSYGQIISRILSSSPRTKLVHTTYWASNGLY